MNKTRAGIVFEVTTAMLPALGCRAAGAQPAADEQRFRDLYRLVRIYAEEK